MSRFTKALVARFALAAAAASLVGASAPVASSTTSATTFSGRATAVKGNIAGIDLSSTPELQCGPGTNPSAKADFCIADTNSVPETGGANEASLACYPKGTNCVIESPAGDPTNGAVSATVLHASVVSRGNRSAADAYAANVGLNVAGITLAAEFLRAQAEAKCTSGVASISGSAEVAKATVNGVEVPVLNLNGFQIVVAETPNFDVVAAVKSQLATNPPLQPLVTLLDATGAKIILNEQPTTNSASGNNGQIEVNALHVIVPGVADVTVGAVHADIHCAQLLNCPGGHVFVTSGGWIPLAAGKAHFAAAGRDTTIALTNPWGHVLWNPPVGATTHIKNPYALVAFFQAGNNGYAALHDFIGTSVFSRAKGKLADLDAKAAKRFDGAAVLYWTSDGSKAGSIAGEVLLADLGEPGRNDFFEIALAQAGAPPVSVAGDFLAGGNIQMHGKCV